MPKILRIGLIIFTLFYLSAMSAAQTVPEGITLTAVADDLLNPRGVVVLDEGELLVIEAGTGANQPTERDGTGRISRFVDSNGDGDYNDADERTPLLEGVPSYNSLKLFGTRHDEPFGLADIVQLPDGRIFFTRDDPFAEINRNEETYYGETGIFFLDSPGDADMYLKRPATLNALVYDDTREIFYITESGFNRLMMVPVGDNPLSDDYDGETIALPSLAHDQQPVPAGITLDPTTGDVLVALFSGFIKNYLGEQLSFLPGDAKIMRYDPDTGTLTEEISGLTTAIDVAVDDVGNIYVAELTTVWATPLVPLEFDLYSAASLPDPGGYMRETGRVTMFPADGSAPRVLVDEIDTPTNLTYANDKLYVSTGLGTPERMVMSPDGVQPIEGVLYVIEGFK